MALSVDVTGIVGATARGARHPQPHCGRHLVAIRAARLFLGGNANPPNIPVCVVESEIDHTQKSFCLEGKLTDEEKAAGLEPFATDTPHTPGEFVATVSKNEGKSAQVFAGNVKSFLTFTKQSLFNMVEGMRQAGKVAEAEATVAQYTAEGIDMSPAARNTITKEETEAIFGETQAFKGLNVYIVTTRITTRDSKKHINAHTYDPVPVSEWKAAFTLAAETAPTAA